jgi:hypothetical protein
MQSASDYLTDVVEHYNIERLFWDRRTRRHGAERSLPFSPDDAQKRNALIGTLQSIGCTPQVAARCLLLQDAVPGMTEIHQFEPYPDYCARLVLATEDYLWSDSAGVEPLDTTLTYPTMDSRLAADLVSEIMSTEGWVSNYMRIPNADGWIVLAWTIAGAEAVHLRFAHVNPFVLWSRDEWLALRNSVVPAPPVRT